MKSTYARFIALLLFVALPSAAFAAGQDLGLVSGILGQFTDVLKKFSASIQSSALHLAGVLLAVEIAYFWYQKWGSSEVAEIESIVMLLIKHVVLVGFWFWAMTNSAEILGSIYNFFVSTGQAAVPILDVDNLLSSGIELAQQLQKDSNLTAISFLTSPAVTLTAIIAQLCLIVAFAVLAAQVLLAKIEFMLIVTAAPIYMAFGVFKFSRDWATKTISHAVATGTKILMIYMLGGMMMGVAKDWGVAMQTADLFANPNQLLEIIAGSLVLILLAFFIPTVANALMSGNTSLSGSSAIMGAMAVGAGALAGAAGAAQIAGSAKDKGMSAAGGVKDFLGRMGGGSMADAGAKAGGSATNVAAAAMSPGATSDMNASAGKYVSPPDMSAPTGGSGASRPGAPNMQSPGGGDASTASIGSAVPPPGAGADAKPKIRDQLSGAADKIGGVFSHAQSMASPFDDRTAVGGANIRVD